MDPMIRLESGGNPRAVNNRPQRDGRPATGATGLRQFMPAALEAAGVYRRGGADGWAGVFNIPGHETVRTRQDFMANPAAQEAVYALHRRHLLREAERRGVTRLVGQTVAGVPIDEQTIVNALHFAGPTGGSRFLLTGGQHNPSDGNIRVDEYLRRTAGGGVPAGFEGADFRSVRAPAPTAAPAAAAPDNAAITAQLQAQLAEMQSRQKMQRAQQPTGAPSLAEALALLAGVGGSLALGRAFR